MNQKKARALRKSLGMTKENHRQKEYGTLNKVLKIVYFRDQIGNIKPVKATRTTLVNKNLHFYRRAKKDLKKQQQGL